jgi:hypothetical protein
MLRLAAAIPAARHPAALTKINVMIERYLYFYPCMGAYLFGRNANMDFIGRYMK